GVPVCDEAVVPAGVPVLLIDDMLEHAKMEPEVRFRRGTKSADYARFVLQLNRIGTRIVDRCALQIRTHDKRYLEMSRLIIESAIERLKRRLSQDTRQSCLTSPGLCLPQARPDRIQAVEARHPPAD